VGFSERHAAELEEWIDEYTKDLAPLEKFILPVSSPRGRRVEEAI
jgi:cob(I)alamin adenosyltransferase